MAHDGHSGAVCYYDALREWMARVGNLRRYMAMTVGGHLAAPEEPEVLVEDLRAFYCELPEGNRE